MTRRRYLAASSLTMIVAAILSATPADADPPSGSSLSVDRAVVSGRDVLVSGDLTLGADASSPVVVVNDPLGDDADMGTIPNNLDIGQASMRADPVAGTLTFQVEVLDPTSTLRATPLVSYVWQFDVDGTSWRSRFVNAGIAGSWYPPLVDPEGYFRLCNNIDGYRCDEAVTGTLESGTVEIVVPLTRIQAERGSVITGGASLGPAIMTAANPVVCVCPTADGADPIAYRVPGGVELAIAPAGTDAADAPYDVAVPSRMNGSWMAAVPLPDAGGTYTVFARSCHGAAGAESCVTAETPLAL